VRKFSLVTGAYGFLGRHIAKKLSSEGWQVIGIGHGSWEKEQWCQYGISQFYSSDVTYENLEKIHSHPFDLVIHCAGSGSVGASYENPPEDFRKNVVSTYDLLEFIRLHSPSSHLIIPSSAAVYGFTDKKEINEEYILNPVSPYGLHKKIIEEICSYYSSRYDIQVSIIRFFSIYGAGLQKQLLWDACNKMYNGEFIFSGTGNEVRDFLHITDAVELLFLLSEKKSDGLSIINGGTGKGNSIKEILNYVHENLQANGEITFSNQAREGDPPYMIADTAKSLALGWSPKISIEDGISDYVNWFLSHIERS